MRTTAIVLLLVSLGAQAQYYQPDFPPDEFRQRWNAIFDAIGESAVALVQGAPSARGFEFSRQTNSFYYLSGIETPHAYLWLDGRTREVTLFLPPRNERLERSEGKVLSAADAALVIELTGVDHVKATSDMQGDWFVDALGDPRPVIYTPFRPAERYAESRYELEVADANIARDHWDGRVSREQNLIALLRTRAPKPYAKPDVDVRDLSPILDQLRTIKSEREIELIRRASQLSGLGLMEAMRSTAPGVYEYQLDAAARYVFLLHGARLDGYRSITASGTENISNPHYFRNTRQLQDGDLVLMDYAPDYRYYVSDIGRMWPVNGKFSPRQRELLNVILRYRDEIIARIRPGVTPDQIVREARPALEKYIDSNPFSKPVDEQAARDMIEKGSGAFSHLVGMAVHDVGHYRTLPLQVGTVFSVDPTLRVPSENLYLRYEDIVVVTESGAENFTAFLPAELDDIEATVNESGIVQLKPVQTEWAKNAQTEMLNYLTAMPKAELHLHLEGTLSPETIVEITTRNDLDYFRSVADVRASLASRPPGLMGFLEHHFKSQNVMQSRQDFYDATYNLAKKLKENNIIYSEIFFDPQAHTSRRIAFDDVIDGIHSARVAAQKEFGITMNLIMCINRERSVDSAFEMLDQALPHRDKIIGLGMDSGPEYGNPPTKFAAVYARAREEGYLLTGHHDVDVRDSVKHIWQSLNVIDIDRIDHGLNAVDDQELVAELVRRNMCLTGSPVKRTTDPQLQDIDRISELDAAGVCISVHTDDPEEFDSGYLTNMLILFQQGSGYSKADMTRLMLNAFKATWLPAPEKQQLIGKLMTHARDFGVDWGAVTGKPE